MGYNRWSKIALFFAFYLQVFVAGGKKREREFQWLTLMSFVPAIFFLELNSRAQVTSVRSLNCFERREKVKWNGSIIPKKREKEKIQDEIVMYGLTFRNVGWSLEKDLRKQDIWGKWRRRNGYVTLKRGLETHRSVLEQAASRFVFS